jgi:hypothetical protein
MGIKLRVVLNSKGTGPMIGMELGRIRIVAVHCSGARTVKEVHKEDIKQRMMLSIHFQVGNKA